MKIRFVLIVSLAILLLPVMANAACDYWWVAVPDGRVSPQLTVDSTHDWGSFFRGTAGHSYSFEVQSPDDSALTIFFGSFCPTADGVGWRHTEAIDPALESGPWAGSRASITAPTTTWYYAHITSSGSHDFSVKVVDTTMYSPRWSTWSGFYTSYGLTNTTNASVNVSLKFVKTDGTTAATYSSAIASGTNVFVDTRNLGIGVNLAGQAILTYDGPPGAILADGFIQNPATGVIQPVKFDTVRASH